MDKYEALRQTFGYSSFRSGQEQIVDALLSGRDALCVMPTGGGKSICFQIPALLLPGIALVISPLISLMKDQVASLNQAGVRAAYLNSSLTSRQYAHAIENACSGMYKIIYVAPERLESPCSSAPERGPFPVPLEVLADVWDLGDVGIGLMTIFNMIALIPLSGQAIDSLKDYERKEK